MGILYVVATPIGNLEDITIRAIKTLISVPVIACEDTRRTGQLLKILEERYSNFLNITPSSPPLNLRGGNPKGEGDINRHYVSVRDWNEAGVVDQIVRELEFNDVALVSDGGTPLISDPGYKLVSRARELGIKIIPIPGPSAVTAALSVSGLPTNRFVFWGFWSRKFKLMEEATNVIFESPVRLGKTLTEIKERYPEAQIRVAKELTKIHEDISDGEGDLTGNNPKGEATILVYVPKV